MSRNNDEGWSQGSRNVPAVRIPFSTAIGEKYRVDEATWNTLVEAIFPSARTSHSIGLAIDYCRSRKLDILKKPVHIVPVYDRSRNAEVETIWPSIAEIRTTAHRTGQYAGADAIEYGPTITTTFRGVREVWKWDDAKKKRVKDRESVHDLVLEHPEWASLTVYRLDKTGTARKFVGPRVYWLEAYATGAKEIEGYPVLPNSMWQKRKIGQLAKVAEAAALRFTFPEELGNEYAAEEMEGQSMSTIAGPTIGTGVAAAGTMVDEEDDDRPPTDAPVLAITAQAQERVATVEVMEPRTATVQERAQHAAAEGRPLTWHDVDPEGLVSTYLDGERTREPPFDPSKREDRQADVVDALRQGRPLTQHDVDLMQAKTAGEARELLQDRPGSEVSGDPVDDLPDESPPLMEKAKAPPVEKTAVVDPLAVYDGPAFLEKLEAELGSLTADDFGVKEAFDEISRMVAGRKDLFPPDRDEALEILQRHFDLLGLGGDSSGMGED